MLNQLRAWCLGSPGTVAALGLPAASMLLPTALRDGYLMVLEACFAVVTIVALVTRRRGAVVSPRAWHWAWILFGLGSVDFIYNLPGPNAPRYPRNHVADLLLIVVVVALIAMANRGWRRRVTWSSTLLVLVVAMATLQLQVTFVLGPLMAAPGIPHLAIVDAWLYGMACSALVGLLVLRSWQAIHAEEHMAAQGLLLMAFSDFAQRQDALGANGAMGWNEAGWAAGLGLLGTALRHGRGQLPWRASARQAPWSSARCALGGLTFVGNMVLLVGAQVGGLLEISHGTDLTGILWLLWIGWFASNMLALHLSAALEQIGALVPVPQVTWCTAQHPVTVTLQPIEARTRLAELDGWVSRYNRLVRQLNPLIAGASRHHETHAYRQLAEHLAHDIRAPIAALDAALDAMGPQEGRAHEVLREAAQRIHDVADALLIARRAARDALDADAALLALSAPRGLPAAPRAASGEATPLARVLQLVERDTSLRHGRGWAQAVAFPPPEHTLGLALAAPCAQVVAALGNLVDNAIEATPCAPGAVRIHIARGPDAVCVRVVDLGRGMARNVFEALGHRSISAGKRNGNGLGVLAATHAARTWGGALAYSLPAEGGTEARLTVPLAPAAAPAGVDADAPGQGAAAAADAEPTAAAASLGAAGPRLRDDAPQGTDGGRLHAAHGAQAPRHMPEQGPVPQGAPRLDDALAPNGAALAARPSGPGSAAVHAEVQAEVRGHGPEAPTQAHGPSRAGGDPAAGIEGAAEGSGAITVLVDDDPLVRRAWALAADRAGATLLALGTAEACLRAAATLPRHARFYLDTQLGGALTGHDLARALMRQGFDGLVVMQSAGGGAAVQMEDGPNLPYRVIASKHAPFRTSASGVQPAA